MSSVAVLKRHDKWVAFCSPLCPECVKADHGWLYLLRYMVAAADEERCCCPCHSGAKPLVDRVAQPPSAVRELAA